MTFSLLVVFDISLYWYSVSVVLFVVYSYHRTLDRSPQLPSVQVTFITGINAEHVLYHNMSKLSFFTLHHVFTTVTEGTFYYVNMSLTFYQVSSHFKTANCSSTQTTSSLPVCIVSKTCISFLQPVRGTRVVIGTWLLWVQVTSTLSLFLWPYLEHHLRPIKTPYGTSELKMCVWLSPSTIVNGQIVRYAVNGVTIVF